MTRWWLMAIGLTIGLTACGSSLLRSAGEWQPWATDCATKETFVEAGDSALEGVIVDCLTGQKIPGVKVVAIGVTDTAVWREATSDASGRYRLQLPEGRYHVSIDDPDILEVEIEIRAQHATVKEMRLDPPICPPERGNPAVVRQADIDALIAAVLDHYAAAGTLDSPRPSDSGPTYVTFQSRRTLALPSNIARQYIVTTRADLQGEADRSDREIRFIHIFDREIKIARSCATVTVGGDHVVPKPVVALGCDETELFLRHGDRWVFRTSRIGACT